MLTATRWLAECIADGDLAFRIGRRGDEVIAEWIGLATLTAHRDGSGARLEAMPGADPRDLAKIERGSARLLLRHLTGNVALHGAAVAVDGRAIVLLGRSGAGKSTLAAAMCGHPSARLFADDAVAIDDAAPSPPRWNVLALEAYHWLDEDAREALSVEGPRRVPVVAGRLGEGTAPLHAFVDLAFADAAPQLVRLQGVDAIASLVPQAVRFVLDEPQLHRLELDVLARFVEHVPIYRLVRPRRLDLLGETSDLLVRLAGETDREEAKKRR